ncbi:MAG: hypothetical protein MHMPM18_000170 [Marteilia pararefringens]
MNLSKSIESAENASNGSAQFNYCVSGSFNCIPDHGESRSLLGGNSGIQKDAAHDLEASIVNVKLLDTNEEARLLIGEQFICQMTISEMRDFKLRKFSRFGLTNDEEDILKFTFTNVSNKSELEINISIFQKEGKKKEIFNEKLPLDDKMKDISEAKIYQLINEMIVVEIRLCQKPLYSKAFPNKRPTSHDIFLRNIDDSLGSYSFERSLRAYSGTYNFDHMIESRRSNGLSPGNNPLGTMLPAPPTIIDNTIFVNSDNLEESKKYSGELWDEGRLKSLERINETKRLPRLKVLDYAKLQKKMSNMTLLDSKKKKRRPFWSKILKICCSPSVINKEQDDLI